ncbi:MAG: GGDEF domain-containing protein [Pyrinomonadaceae bacterium]
MDSKIGLIIQLNGVFVVTVMCMLLSRSLRLTALKYWTIAWLSMSFALISLRLGFEYSDFGSLLFSYYFLGEYIFGFLLVSGCRSLDAGWELKTKNEVYFIPFLALAIGLPLLSSDFNHVYAVHALCLSGFFATASRALRRSSLRTFGWKVMNVALAALALNFFLYSIVYTASQFTVFDTSFLSYNSIVDLVLQTALGVGMVIVLLEKVLTDARSAHERLETTNKRLEELVHTDPLTAAFSRHAFYGFVKKQGSENSETSGCVGFFDIDDLKWINDRYGHSAGDLAIRAVARGIRDTVRSEDLIFRWGGDEFFVIMISMDAEMATMRMTKLERDLAGIMIDGIPELIDIGVSWGFTDFSDISGLEDAINKADAAMYCRKLERKKRRAEKPAFIPDLLDVAPRLSV